MSIVINCRLLAVVVLVQQRIHSVNVLYLYETREFVGEVHIPEACTVNKCAGRRNRIPRRPSSEHAHVPRTR